LKHETWIGLALIFGFIFSFLLSYTYHVGYSAGYDVGYSAGYDDAWKTAYQVGYNNAVIEMQLNLTRRAEAFVSARPWHGEVVFYLGLKDFVNSAWELHGVLWIFKVRLTWSDTYEEACLYHIHNQTLHVYYLP